MKTFYLQNKINRKIIYQDQVLHYFSGTSYLGIDLVPEFRENLIIGMDQYGLNHGLSRINNIRLQIFEEFEEFFAKKAGAVAAIVMSSGYLSGMAALQYLKPKAQQIWVAPDTHPAILPINLKPSPKQCFQDWKDSCIEKSKSLKDQRILILGNAVNPMIPEIHDYGWLEVLAQSNEVTLLLDDSHAFGVLGYEVFGTYSQWKDLPIHLMVTGSLGKALGLPAGIILSNQQMIDEVKQLPIYGGASPCPPAYLHAFLKSQEIYKDRRSRLFQLIKYFGQKNEMPEHVHGLSNYPTFTYEPGSWAEKLEQKNYITSSFPYPTSDDQTVNRIILSAFHTARDIDTLWFHLKEISNSI